MKKTFLSVTIASLLLATTAFAANESQEQFVPNGSLTASQTFYGNSGKYKTATSKPELIFDYNFTPEWNVNAQWTRSTNLHDYDQNNHYNQNNNTSTPEININYNHGYLGNSKIKWTSNVNYKNFTVMSAPTVNENYAWVTTTFDFAEYMPSSEYAKTTQFAIMPAYAYGWDSQSSDRGHMNSGAIAFLGSWALPANFTFNMQAYLIRDFYNGGQKMNKVNSQGEPIKSYSTETYGAFFAYLNYARDIYKFNENTALSFNFIGGMDPYMIGNKKSNDWFPFFAGNQQYQWTEPTVQQGNTKNQYIAFALPTLQVTAKLTEDISATIYAGAKYSNQVWGDTSKDWKLQPQGGLSLTYNF
ncbi:MAG: FomA family porin-like outer membrane protein [Cetobacterium sp.]